MSLTPWDARWHLQAELARMIEALARLLDRQRQRGRTPAADSLRGVLIEEGEVEGLVHELAAAWTRPPGQGGGGSGLREELDSRANLGAGQGAVLPLRHLRRAFALGPEEYDALLLALAVELDPRFARLVAFLNDHAARTRPTVGLVLTLQELEGTSARDALATWPERPFLKEGLLELEGEGPFSGLALRLPRELLPRLCGQAPADTVAPGVSLLPCEQGLLARLVLEEAERSRVAVWASAWRGGGERRPLVLSGAPGSGRRTLAHAAVSELGLPLVAVDVPATDAEARLRLARREARWHSAALLVRLSAPVDGALLSGLWHTLRGGATPLLVSVGPDEAPALCARAPEEPVRLALETPSVQARAALWERLLPRGDTLPLVEREGLAARFRFTPGRMRHAVRRATAELAALPPGQRRLTVERLESACREVGSAGVGALAQRLPRPYTREELVVPEWVRAELDLAVAWVRHQGRVLEDWGLGRRVAQGRGLTALFCGKPGTGKTMAAQVLAAELGLDVFRVDLSQVTSKYIGETEKNLGRLFDEAHAANAVLFFDEADALFGKRSEVKDAHDRYANVEIGYLLQRMEAYEGVTLLATNRAGDMDEAFRRRFHVVIEFPMPGEPDRLRIWRSLLPDTVERGPDVDLAQLARAYELSGGEIKNAVLAAAFLAAAEGAPVGQRHLTRAVRREILKNGRVLDESAADAG